MMDGRRRRTWAARIDAAQDQTALNILVEELLIEEGIADQTDLSFGEQAARIADSHPNVAALLTAAETRWFELDN